MPTGTYDKEKDTIWPFFLNSLNPSTKVRGVLIFPDIITGVRRGNGGILGSRYGTCSMFPGPGSHSLVNYYSVVAGGASVANYRRGAAPVLAQWRFQLINMLSLCLSLWELLYWSFQWCYSDFLYILLYWYCFFFNYGLSPFKYFKIKIMSLNLGDISKLTTIFTWPLWKWNKCVFDTL